MKKILVGVAAIWFCVLGNSANAAPYAYGPIFSGCYNAEASMQIDNFEGVHQITSTTYLSIQSTPPELVCPVVATAKLFLFKWDNGNRRWSICTQSAWISDDTGFIPGEIFLLQFSGRNNLPTCGAGYYLNYSYFCAQYEIGGARSCDGRRSPWEYFPG